MGKENHIKYYLNQPIQTSIGKSLYCILLKDWDEYRQIAMKYLTICEDLLRRRLELPEEIKLFDYVVMVAFEEREIEKLERMFSLAFKEEVKCFCIIKDGKAQLETMQFVVGDFEKRQCFINRDNYEEIRNIMKEQSFIHDPLIGKSEMAQKMIDKAIQKRISANGDKKSSLEAKLIMNSSKFPIDYDTYTYYQLQTQFEIINRLEMSRATHIYRSVGAKIDIPMLDEELSIHENPFSFEKLFRVDNKKLGG